MIEDAKTYLKWCSRQGGALRLERATILGSLVIDHRRWIIKLLSDQNADGGYSGEKPGSNLDDGCSSAPGMYFLDCLKEGIEPTLRGAMREALDGMVDFHLRSQHASGLFVQAATFDDQYADGTCVWDTPPYSRHGDHYRAHPGHNDRRTLDAVEFLSAMEYPGDNWGDLADRIRLAGETTVRLYDEGVPGLYEDYDGTTYRSGGGSPVMVPAHARPHEIPEMSPRAVGWGGETIIVSGIEADRTLRNMAHWLDVCCAPAPDGPWWPQRVDCCSLQPVYGTEHGARVSIRSLAKDKNWTKTPRAFLRRLEAM